MVLTIRCGFIDSIAIMNIGCREIVNGMFFFFLFAKRAYKASLKVEGVFIG